MTTTEIKKRLHNYVETADSKKLKAIYIMVEDDIEEDLSDYTDEFKLELDRRYDNYKNGNGTTVSPNEMKDRIGQILKSRL
jgi:putative addiction module component (TIGR02574 family)